MNQVVEPRQVFRPAHLPTRELLGGGEVLEVLVIGQYEDHMCRALQIVAPLPESLEYGEELLVIDLVVELGRLHAAGVERDRVNVTILGRDLGDDCCNRIIGSVSFNNNWIIRVEMCQDGCRGEGVFEGFERLHMIGTPGERGVLAGETNEGDDDVGEPNNESAIEVGEA